eukprot:1292443-Rhodomonas_salina.2
MGGIFAYDRPTRCHTAYADACRHTHKRADTDPTRVCSCTSPRRQTGHFSPKSNPAQYKLCGNCLWISQRRQTSVDSAAEADLVSVRGVRDLDDDELSAWLQPVVDQIEHQLIGPARG